MGVLTSEGIRKAMRANRSGNALEREFRSALRAAGIRGYRKEWSTGYGRLDVAWPGRRVGVFVHGCFWHRCPDCRPPVPKTNRDDWLWKFSQNRERDAYQLAALHRLGWEVLVVWEHDVRPDPAPAVAAVLEALGRR